MWSRSADLAQQLPLRGRRLSDRDWLTVAMMEALGAPRDLIASPSGVLVDLNRKSSTDLSVKECADVITWLTAVGDEAGVKWRIDDRPTENPREIAA